MTRDYDGIVHRKRSVCPLMQYKMAAFVADLHKLPDLPGADTPCFIGMLLVVCFCNESASLLVLRFVRTLLVLPPLICRRLFEYWPGCTC